MTDQAQGVLRRVLANTGLLLGGRTLNALISLAYMAVAARALGVSTFGALVLINTFAQFVGEVVRFQSWQTVLQYGTSPLAEGRRDAFQRVVRFSLVLDLASGVVGTVVGVAGILALAPAIGLPADLGGVGALYALTIAVMVPATQVGLLRIFDRFDLMSVQAALSSLVRLVGGAICWALDLPLSAFLVAWAAGTVAAFAYLAVACWGELGRRDLRRGFAWRGPLTAGMPGAWRFAWTTNFSGTVEVAFGHVATLMVGGLLGSTEAALWRVARQVADAMAKPARLLIPALYPELARLRAEGHRAMARLAGQVGLIGGGFATLLLVVVMFAGGPLLSLVMGPAFAAAAPTMTWQVAAAVIGVWALPLEPMLVSMGRPGAVLGVRLAVAVAFIAVLPSTVAAYGMRGAGVALTLAALALAIGMLSCLMMAMRRQAPVTPPTNPLP